MIDRLLLTEIREGREVLDAVLLGQSLVVDLDEIDAKVVRVIVDLFQFGQDFVAGCAASCICKNGSITR